AQTLGVRARLSPATDQPVRTFVETDEGVLGFQDYFVRRRCAPRITAIRYDGAATAAASPALRAALQAPDLRGIVIAPSNPMLSIAPVLEINGVRAALADVESPIVAVTPIIAGKAVKGPTTKIMEETGVEISPLTVARSYRDILDGFVLDREDAD